SISLNPYCPPATIAGDRCKAAWTSEFGSGSRGITHGQANKDSPTTVLHSVHRSRLPRVVIALEQPAPDLHRHVEFRRVFGAGRDRNQGAQYLPLLLVGQSLVSQIIFVVGQPRFRDSAP